jgi:hypothetical protein
MGCSLCIHPVRRGCYGRNLLLTPDIGWSLFLVRKAIYAEPGKCDMSVAFDQLFTIEFSPKNIRLLWQAGLRDGLILSGELSIGLPCGPY